MRAAQAWQSESDLRSLAKNKSSKQSVQSQPWTSTHALWFTGTNTFPILIIFLIKKRKKEKNIPGSKGTNL